MRPPTTLNNDAEADRFLRTRPELWVAVCAYHSDRLDRDELRRAAGLADQGDVFLLLDAADRRVKAVAETVRYAPSPR